MNQLSKWFWIRFGIAVLIVIGLVIGAFILSSRSTDTITAPAGQEETSTPTTALNDQEKSLIEEQRGNSQTEAGITSARSVALKWASIWGKGSSVSAQGLQPWLDQLKPYSTPTLITRMGSIDMTNLPNIGSGIESIEEEPNSNRGNAVNFIITFSSGFRLEVSSLVQPDKTWRVGTYGAG